MGPVFYRSRSCEWTNGSCVEVALEQGSGSTPDTVLVRDSKKATGDIVLRYSVDDWGNLLQDILEGNQVFVPVRAGNVGIEKEGQTTLFELSHGDNPDGKLYFTEAEVKAFVEEAEHEDSGWEIRNLKRPDIAFA